MLNSLLEPASDRFQYKLTLVDQTCQRLTIDWPVCYSEDVRFESDDREQIDAIRKPAGYS
jgi:hypothetical protein